MSEPDQASPVGDTAGSILRRAREAAGLHVASLAVALKVPVRKLEALEEDRHDLLPDAVFVRALASSVCRNLKIDPQPVLDRLPQTSAPRLVQTRDGINAPFRSPGDGPKPGVREALGRPVVLTVVALLLATAAVVFLPVAQREADAVISGKSDPLMPPGTPAALTPAPAEPRVGVAEPAKPAAAPPAVAAAPTPTPTPAAPPPPVAAAPTAPPAVEAPAAAPPAPATTATISTSPPVAAADPAATPASAAKATGVVVFRTRANSWIQVTDARGNQVFRKMMEPGETAGASGALPLSVTVGSAESTEVEVRGKPFNLGPVSRDNVARFEIK